MKSKIIVFSAILLFSMGIMPQLFAQKFDFNDGTTQGWTMQGAYDENMNGPYMSNFTLSWTSLVNYPTTGTGKGSLLFFTSGGHGVTGSSGSYWIMQFISPDLSSKTSWQNITGISARIVENMTVGSTLYANIIVTVYDKDQAKDRSFYNDQLLNQPLTYSSWFNSNAVWNSLTFDWSTSSTFPANYTVKRITIQIMGKMTGLIDGQVGIDEVEAQGGGTPTASIKVTNPNGGEQWEADTPQIITWTGQGIDNYDVKIEYSTNNGSSYSFITYKTNYGTSGSYTWTVPNEPSKNCLIRLSVLQTTVISDVSDAVFEITANPYIKVDVPNGGENWNVGSPRYIVWNTHLFDGAVKIEYSTNGGSSYSTITNSYSGMPSYQWTVPNTPSSNCLVKVSDATDGQPFDVSDAVFTISSTAQVNTPAGTNVIVNVTGAIQLLFTQVINPGNTEALISPIGPIPPANMTVILPGNPVYYEIKTTATYSGLIAIEITYNDAGLAEHEKALQLMRYEEGSKQWTDITKQLYTDINIIRGETDHLSVFAIMYPGSSFTPGGAILVTNCDDSGPGSLREAISYANSHPGPDTIRFTIPKGVPGYDADIGVWTIAPQSSLPVITDGLVVDGFSQAAFIGEDANPLGPEIEISGVSAGQYEIGLYVKAFAIEIFGLTINHFRTGIGMYGVGHGRISGCYVGTNFAANAAAPNTYGIWLGDSTKHVMIVPIDTFRNVISGNTHKGICISDTSHHNVIADNIIGLNRTGIYPIGNDNYGGVCIQDYSYANEIHHNHIGGNKYGLFLFKASGNVIAHNFIGTDPTWEKELGNQHNGIYLCEGSQNNLITENIIAYSGAAGIHIMGAETVRNRITRNGISRNVWGGIYNEAGGNGEFPPPTITSATATSVAGTAVPNATIELYSDLEDEGQIYQGAVMANGSGNFMWNGTIIGPYTHITAIAIDPSGNTSAFSKAVQTNVDSDDSEQPSSFSLAQNYPNPFNPNTTIQFEVPFAGNQMTKVELRIYNVQGELIRTLVNEEKSTGVYQAQWDGLNETGNPAASGIYLYQFRAGDLKHCRKMILMK